ncbi:MAG: GNAT family N-acetyltransferase [Acidimicrobiia bacterium]
MPGPVLLPRSTSRTLRWPGGSARLAPWHGRSDIASLTMAASRAPSASLVERGLEWLRRAGYATVITNALGPNDVGPFMATGFGERERLHLLQHDLTALVRPALRTRRVSRRRTNEVLELDQQCFDRFWAFDTASLNEALRATPQRRFRVIRAHHTLLGYAITGRAGKQGYIQRIGVADAARQHGIGTALVADALHWLRAHGVARALVNTQHGNTAALRLYERCGFTLLPVELAVLERSL